MKNIIVVLLVFFSIQQGQSQIEVSTNPLTALFNAIPISASKPITNDISVGLDMFFLPEENVSIFYGKSRYYFNPQYGADRFHIGVFGGFFNRNVGIGFLGGYKLMSKRGVFLDVAVGIGRGFVEGSEYNNDNVLPYGQLHLGYRFGKKTLDEKAKNPKR